MLTVLLKEKDYSVVVHRPVNVVVTKEWSRDASFKCGDWKKTGKRFFLQFIFFQWLWRNERIRLELVCEAFPQFLEIQTTVPASCTWT